MRKLIGFAVVLLLGCSSLQTSNPPPSVKSEYLRSLGAGFAIIRESGDKKGIQFNKESCKYSILLAPNKKLESPLYLKVLFQNPLDDKQPSISETVLKPGMKNIEISSTDMHGFKKGTNYQVTVEIYDSESYTSKLGEHVQSIRSESDVK